MSAASIKVKQSGKITEVVLYVAFSWPVIPAPIRKHLMRTTGLIMQNTNTGRNTKRKIHKIHDSISLFQLQSKAIFTSEFIDLASTFESTDSLSSTDYKSHKMTQRKLKRKITKKTKLSLSFQLSASLFTQQLSTNSVEFLITAPAGRSNCKVIETKN